MIYALAERAHLPLAALVLLVGIALAVGARDMMKRLLGAGAAAIAGASHLIALAPEASAGAGLAAVVLLLAACALGVVLVVRIQEAFGGADAARIRKGLEEDAALLEAEAP